jgi:sulfite reductase beta subunit-like hemoprotein
LLRRVASEQVNEQVERLVESWIQNREPGEGLPEYFRRVPDENILAIAAGEAVGA